jgi:hypothetical protein
MTISTKDAIMIHMLKTGMFDGATLTVKGLVGANLVAARVALQELPKPLTQEDIDSVLAFIIEAEATLEYLGDVEE